MHSFYWRNRFLGFVFWDKLFPGGFSPRDALGLCWADLRTETFIVRGIRTVDDFDQIALGRLGADNLAGENVPAPSGCQSYETSL